ncbi:MAG: hypothetical protein ACOYL6_10310 [Bacteriovoracaceae bacterium]
MEKSIIFIKPLSESLVKLKDTISTDPIYSIYEVEDTAEYKQLAANIGASLTICSDLKKLAKALSDSKAIYKKYNSKSLLLSKERLTFTITDKLQKLGVTEILYEPIVPKTLLYKVSFISKSLKNAEVKSEEEVLIKSLKQEKETGETKLAEKEKQNQLSEEIKAKEEKESSDLKPNKKAINLATEAAEGLNPKKSKKDIEIDLSDPNKKLAQETSEIEEDKKKKKDIRLELESEENKRNKNAVQEIEEKLKKKKALLEELKARKEKEQLAVQADAMKKAAEKKRLEQSNIDLSKPVKEKVELNLELAQEEKKGKPSKDEAEEEKQLKEKSQIEKNKKDLKRDISLELENEEQEKKKSLESLPDIELPSKNKLDKIADDKSPLRRKLQEDDEEEKEALNKLQKLKDEIAQEDEKKELSKIEKNGKERAKSINLMLEDEDKEKKKKEIDEAELGLLKNEKTPKQDEPALSRKKKEKSELEEVLKKTKKINLDLEGIEEPEEEKTKLEDDKKKRQKSLDLELEAEEEEKNNDEEKEKTKNKNFTIEDEQPELNLEGKFKEDSNEIDLELKELSSELDNNWDYENQDAQDDIKQEKNKDQTLDYNEFDEYVEEVFTQFTTGKKRNKDHDDLTADDLGYGQQKEHKNQAAINDLYLDEEAMETTPSLDKAEVELAAFFNAKLAEGLTDKEMKKALREYIEGKIESKEGKAFLEEITAKKEGKAYLEENLDGVKKKGKGYVEEEYLKAPKNADFELDGPSKSKRKGKEYIEEEESNKQQPIQEKLADVLPFRINSAEEEAFLINSPIIPSNLKGLEYVLGAQKLMQKDHADPQAVLQYIAEKLMLQTNSMVTFYKNTDSVYVLTYSSQGICYEPELYLGISWEQFESANKARWESHTTPTWRDETYTQELNEFIYPFYEGDKPLGMAIVHSWQQIKNREKAFYVEVLVEATRGYFLHCDEVQQVVHIENTNIEAVPLKKKVVAFFKKLFRMAA